MTAPFSKSTPKDAKNTQTAKTAKSPKEITILQLYPRDMNIYGDTGNLLVLTRRLEWHGYTPRVIYYNVGDRLPAATVATKPDIILGGGGQDSGQIAIHKDLLAVGDRLRQWADEGTPMLMVCGLYQLFGHSFKTLDGTFLEGIGILDVKTIGTTERLIGNIVTHSPDFGNIIGYENHSGQTYLGKSAQPFATVVKGAGNNTSEGHEGARYKHVIGTYLHGSLLPKNPAVADYLIETAVTNRYGSFDETNIIDDSFAKAAREAAQNRPR